ncbi:hypothetical protein [Pseudoalteromonas virus vB_PspP-H6/1]|nr:hypothetical protein [Pseudoalteromonas virus vB_PspP-H6/1]
MKPFSRSWTKLNQKTWVNSESGFVVCNESYQGLNGRRQKSYAIYPTLRAQDHGEVIEIKCSFSEARAEANYIFDRMRKKMENNCKYKYSGIHDCFGEEIRAGDTIMALGDSFAGKVYYSFLRAAFRVKLIKVDTGAELKNCYDLPKFIKQRERAAKSKVSVVEL